LGRVLRFTTISVAALILISGSVSCAKKPATDWAALKLIEVKEYQGQNLSSVSDFVENSIKGPQYININTYRLIVDGLVNKPLDLTYNEVLNKYTDEQRLVRLNCVEG